MPHILIGRCLFKARFHNFCAYMFDVSLDGRKAEIPNLTTEKKTLLFTRAHKNATSNVKKNSTPMRAPKKNFTQRRTPKTKQKRAPKKTTQNAGTG